VKNKYEVKNQSNYINLTTHYSRHSEYANATQQW